MASKKLSKEEIKVFKKTIYSFYKANKRDLPWRFGFNHDVTPYMIFVSEVMLQQTQVDRVIPKFNAFMKKFPSFKSLALANKKEVLTFWSGLGYNRRALSLKQSCFNIYKIYNGLVPENIDALLDLPGIGPYTANALLIFIYNMPQVCIETNIRSVFIHYFFKNKKTVTDKELYPLIKMTLDIKNPREWYYALMDYGSFIKKKEQNPNRKSKSYKPQSKFKDSQRFFRGTIIKLLLKKQMLEKDIYKFFDPIHTKEVQKALKNLVNESFLIKEKGQYRIY